MTGEYDVLVIGGGPAGEVAAGDTAAGGLKVALIESERVGGECSFWACIPSKALLRGPDVRQMALHTPGVRPLVRGPVVAEEAIAFRNQMVHQWDDRSQAEWLKGAGVTLIRGRARLTGPRAVVVRDESSAEHPMTARRAIVLAVGSQPVIPDVPGLRAARPWLSRDATSAKAAPRRLLVLGGGPVALEMAQAWRALGAESVTVLERGDRLLPRMEPFVGESLARSFRDSGIELRLHAQLREVLRDGGEVTATLESGDLLRADEILVATGRRPATRDLGLETIGLEPGKPIAVDDRMRATAVSEGWLYAIGDVNGRHLLTHMGKYQGRVVGQVLKGHDVSAAPEHRATPQVIFTQPQVAAVGLTEAAAREAGLRVRTSQYALEDVAGYSVYGPDFKGQAKLVVDADREVVVGATLVGLEVGELLHAATIAIACEVRLKKLWQAVPAYPTASEIWLRLLEAL